jgi:RNA polymerase sigma-70 factor (ECF subfamily)
VEATEARDEKALLALFTPDATWTADGGGRVPAGRRAIIGADRVVRLILGLENRLYRGDARRHFADVNGETGLLTWFRGRLFSALSIATDGDRIAAVYIVLNPDKLSLPETVH